MPVNIQELREIADKAGHAFDEACRPHYVNRWGAYRAIERGDKIPASVDKAMNNYHARTQEYYTARDGKHGFLGGRGI